MPEDRPRTRIQEKNRAAILDAALGVFSRNGYRGSTLDQIARAAGLSKPNVLYYFASKDAIHEALVSGLIDTWIEPLRALGPDGDPIEQILAYVHRKLDMSREMPRESRLFANEMVQGAPRFGAEVTARFRALVDEKAALIQEWVDAGRIAPFDPYHLIFSIWATTQHYADFDVQVRDILRPEGNAHFEDAAAFLTAFYRAALTPR